MSWSIETCAHNNVTDNTTHARCQDCGMVRYAFEDWKREPAGATMQVSVKLLQTGEPQTVCSNCGQPWGSRRFTKVDHDSTLGGKTE